MRRIAHAFAACLALDLCSAGFAFWVLRGYRGDNPLAAKVMFAAPTLAALLLFSLIIGFPDLMPTRRLAFPTNLTLPILHNALLWAVVSLAISDFMGIQKMPEALEPATAWLRWQLPVTVAVVQAGVLSLIMLATRERRQASRPAPSAPE